MILADSSVWIDYFNGKACPQTDSLDEALEADKVLIGDLIMLEILQGFRSDKSYRVAKEHLSALDQVAMLSPTLAVKGSQNYRKLRKKGITVRKTADVIIATFCIEHKIPLLFTDRDFQPFVEHLSLKSC